MSDKPFKDGPAYITTSSDDLYVPASGTIADVFHIHLVNTSASPVSVQLYLGATGAEVGGTELYDHTIDADDSDDVYFPAGLAITATDFLVGDAGTGSVVTATITGTLRVA